MAETPTWQYFSGEEYFEHGWRFDPSLLVRSRRSLGEEGVGQDNPESGIKHRGKKSKLTEQEIKLLARR